MSQKAPSDLNALLEGIVAKMGEFTSAVIGSARQLDAFSENIDKKIVQLNDSISALTNVIKEEDEKLSQKLSDLMDGVKSEIKLFRDDIQSADIKETLESLKKLVKIPEKTVINKTVDKVLTEVSEIVKELKAQK
jgi:ABC-type transporter Mla subunit MlaD